MLATIPVAHIEKLRERGFPDHLIESFATHNGRPAIVGYLTANQIQSDWLEAFPSMKGNPGGALLLRFNATTVSLKPDKPDWDEKHQRFKKYLYTKNNTETPGANVQPWIPPAHLGEPRIATEGLFDALVCTYIIGVPCAAITAPSHLRGSILPRSITTYLSDADVPYHHHLGLLSTVISQGRERNLLLAHLPRNPHADYQVTDRIPEDCKWGMEEWAREWRAQGLDPKEQLEAVIRSARKPAQYLRQIILDYAKVKLSYPLHTPTLSNAARAIADAATSESEVVELTALLEHSTKTKRQWIDSQIKQRMQRRVEKGLPVALSTLDAKSKELALQVAAAAIYDDKDIPAHKRAFYLQQRAAELEVRGLNKVDLSRYFHDIRRKREGSSDPLRKGDKLDRTSIKWAWEGIFRYGTSNLIVAAPKVGKTNMTTQLIADWHQGKGSFLGRELHGPCPPVVIVGPDMNDGDWYEPLLRAGMVREDGSIEDPILALFTAKHRFVLDPDGIERLVNLAEECPGYLLLIDSYHAALLGMGISEKDESLGDPLIDAQQALSPYGITIAVIHHSGKGAHDGSATMASRGHTSLPAAASMNISLSRKEQTNPLLQQDERITLKAQGRGGAKVEILIQQTDQGWVLHGNAADVGLVEHVGELIEELTEGQDEALKDIAHHWQSTGVGVDAQQLATGLKLTAADPAKAAAKLLAALEKKGLVSRDGTADAKGKGGRPRVLFRPHDAVIPHYPLLKKVGCIEGNGGIDSTISPNTSKQPMFFESGVLPNAECGIPSAEPPNTGSAPLYEPIDLDDLPF